MTNVALFALVVAPVCQVSATVIRTRHFDSHTTLGRHVAPRLTSRESKPFHISSGTFASEPTSKEKNSTNAEGLGEDYGLDWEEKGDHIESRTGTRNEAFFCGKAILAHRRMDPDERCPSACPFVVQDKGDDNWCSFRCVKAAACTEFNPKTPIADTEKGICRAPAVYACKEPMTDGTDACKVCNDYYFLFLGHCRWNFVWLTPLVLGIIGVLGVFVVLWVVDLAMRPVSNEETLRKATVFRARMKLHQPGGECHESDPPKPWPLFTNFHTALVAGPGFLLHMNFQIAVIIWAFMIICIWVALGLFIDSDLFRIGTSPFGSPLKNCYLVQWGYDTQQKLMWVKILFLSIVYVLSIIFSFVYSVYQLRKFQQIDWETKTMKDFVAYLTVPSIKGTERPEEALRDELAKATGKKIVGVSMAWIYQQEQERVEWLIQDWIKDAEEDYHEDALQEENEETPRSDTMRQQRTRSFIVREAEEAEQSYNLMTRHRAKLVELEEYLLAPGDDPPNVDDEDEIKAMLEGLEAEEGFVVFETEADRDEAVKQFEGGLSIQVCGEAQPCTLKNQRCEPDTVLWQNFGPTSWSLTIQRILKAILAVFVALSAWTLVFYAPYAFAMINFNYDNGQEPGILFGLAFTVVVVAGNAIMYEVCARISDSSGFKFLDSRETCYFLLYLTACMLNVLLDLVVTYYMGEQIMIGLGFRTVTGEKLDKVTSFVGMFETYAMQRIMAKNAYEYAFPSTFLIPFLIEPFAMCVGPVIFGTWIVGSHPEIQGHAAEDFLAAPVMDLGRYADIMLNMFLGLFFFYFPGGNTHALFLGMVGSHLWIYIFDYLRVLRSMKAFYFASMTVEWWAQLVLGLGCGFILSCIVFKANCQGYGYCLEGRPLLAAWAGSFLLHFAVHTVLHIFWVPTWGKKDEDLGAALGPHPEGTYKDVNTRIPCSWFNSNMVHCLRSKYIYEHERPCLYKQMGREHLLTINEELGCHFHCKPRAAEGFSFQELLAEVKQNSQTFSPRILSTRSLEAPEEASSPAQHTAGEERSPGEAEEHPGAKA